MQAHKLSARLPISIAAGAVLLAFASQFLLPAHLITATQMLTMLSLAMLWNLVAGYSNIVVIGQHAYVGIGAYAFYGLAVILGLPWTVAIPLVVMISVVVASAFYAILFRLRTAYLAVGSWVLAETVMLAASRLPGFGSGTGAAIPAAYLRLMGDTAGDRLETVYLLTLALACTILISCWMILNSRIGLALQAIRDNEDGAAVVGVNTAVIRASAYIVAAPFIALTAIVITLQKGRISPMSSFSMLDWTIYVLFIVVIGGIGTLEGPIIGTVLFFVIRSVLAEYGDWYLIAMGAIAITVILIEPRGLTGLARRLWSSYRSKQAPLSDVDILQ